jgi:hypothetical protein
MSKRLAKFDADARPTVADELRPRTLEQLTFHEALDRRLRHLVTSGVTDMPNLLFYGPKGAGKQTRVHALLNAIYSGIAQSGEDKRTSKTPVADASKHRTLHVDCLHGKRERHSSNNAALAAAGNALLGGSGVGSGHHSTSSSSAAPTTSVDIDCVTSPFHIELTPCDVDGKDVFVVQQCVKHVCSDMMPLATMVSQRGTNAGQSVPLYRIIVIRGADRLRFDAQAAMRRFMESHASRVRFILVCEQFSRIMPALRSRCLCLRVPAPSDLALAKFMAETTRTLRIGGRFGGNRERWKPRNTAAAAAYYNDANDRGVLPVPTMTLLLRRAYHDATYLQTLAVTNHTPAIAQNLATTDAQQRTRKRARKRAPKKLLSAANGGVEVPAEMALTDRDALIVPSWIATMALLARVLVRGYAAVKNNRALLDAWGVDDCGPATYHVPMLEWSRRVAHELISRCVPLRRMMQELLMALLDEIDALRDATQNGTREPSVAVERHAAPIPEAWSDKRCDALRERVIDLLAAYEQQLAVPFRAVVPLDALFVHLSDACEQQRANRHTLENQSVICSL